MTLTEELLAGLNRAAFDPAFITSFKGRLIETGLWDAMGCPTPKQKFNCAPPMAPAASDITAIRAGLWDNHPGGFRKPNHPNRYALSLNLWNLPADQIEAVRVKSMNDAFSTNVSLMDAKALRAQVRNLRKPRKNALSTVDPDYLDALLAISQSDPSALFGMINTNIGTDDSEFHRGVYYHPFQFVIVKMKDGTVDRAILVNGLDSQTDLAPFVPHDCHGEKLKGVIAQSRLDLVGFDESWPS